MHPYQLPAETPWNRLAAVGTVWSVWSGLTMIAIRSELDETKGQWE